MAVVKDDTVVVCWSQFDVWLNDELVPVLIKDVLSPLNRWGAGLRYQMDPTLDQMIQHYLLEGAFDRLLERMRPMRVRQDRGACNPYL